MTLTDPRGGVLSSFTDCLECCLVVGVGKHYISLVGLSKPRVGVLTLIDPQGEQFL